MMRYGFLIIFCLLDATAFAQTDTYILRNMDYGKKVKAMSARGQRCSQPWPVEPRQGSAAGAGTHDRMVAWALSCMTSRYAVFTPVVQEGVLAPVQLRLRVAADGHVEEVLIDRFFPRVLPADEQNYRYAGAWQSEAQLCEKHYAEVQEQLKRYFLRARFAPAPELTEEVLTFSLDGYNSSCPEMEKVNFERWIYSEEAGMRLGKRGIRQMRKDLEREKARKAGADREPGQKAED